MTIITIKTDNQTLIDTIVNICKLVGAKLNLKGSVSAQKDDTKQQHEAMQALTRKAIDDFVNGTPSERIPVESVDELRKSLGL